jgi:ABC-2 type transport system permease protein
LHLVGVFRAFLFLVITTFRNRLFQRIRRLRHPRYLVGLAFGLFYFWAVFLRSYPSGLPAHASGQPIHFGDLPIRVVSLGLLVFVGRWWLFETGTPVLAFAPAEVQFLFPAPLRRRDLLSYKLMTAQLQLLVSAVVITIITIRLDPEMPAGLRVIGAWIFLVTLYLHHLGASLVRVGVAQTTPSRKRPVVAAAIAGVVAVVMVIGLLIAWPRQAESAGVNGLFAAAAVVLRSPLVGAVLLPFRIALGPLFATTPDAWARALLFAIPLLAVHYIWVLRIDVPFEEAAADASAALADRIRAMRRRFMSGAPLQAKPSQPGHPRRAWFRLRSTGRPAVAIVWKNTIALQRGGWRTVWMTGAFIVAVAAIVMTAQRTVAGSPAVALAAGLASLAWMLAFLGPVAFQNDLRRDVAHLALLRTYPLSGARIVAASIASTVLPLALTQLSMVAIACLVCPSEVEHRPIAVSARASVFVVSAIVLPALDATTATIGNAMALLFPSARALGAAVGGAGADGIGQILLARIASLIGAMLAFVMPTGVAVLANWVARHFVAAPPATLFAIVAFALAYTGQLSLMMRLAGRVFERTDAVTVSAVD